MKSLQRKARSVSENGFGVKLTGECAIS